MTITTTTTLAALVADGTLDGYEQCAPSRLANAVDSSVAADAVCIVCGWHGLAYAPYYHPVTGSYRAFALCPCCRFTFEF